MFRTKLEILILMCAALLLGCADEGPGEQAMVVLTDTFEIDRIYPSMKGPQWETKFRLLDTEKPELLWIKGYHAVITGADGTTPKSQQYMCHSTLRSHPFGNRITEITLAQGQLDLQLPDGFGIPIMAHDEINLFAQVLNLHHTEGIERVRQKISVEFVRDAALKTPIRPLAMHAAFVMVALDGQATIFDVADSDATESQKHASCLPGADAVGTLQNVKRDSLGRLFSGHFVVPPGRHVYRTLATKTMGLRYDTTLHYAAVHLHPFAEWIELRNLTTNESIYKSQAMNIRDGIGLARVEHYSSDVGKPLFRDHEYEIIAMYNNTTDQNQDAMAVMFMYVLDRNFTKPKDI